MWQFGCIKNSFSNTRRIQIYKRSFTLRVKKHIFRKIFVCPELIAQFTVAEPIENTLGLVFFEFRLKMTIYQRKLATRGCALWQEIDSSLQKQIDQQTIHICERHFEKNLIETCKFGCSYSYIIIACELKASVLIFIYGSWAYVMEIWYWFT
jgi:hypothetical protein